MTFPRTAPLFAVLALALAWGAAAQVPLTLKDSTDSPLPDGTAVYVLSREGATNTPFVAAALAEGLQEVLSTRIAGGAGRTEAGVAPTARSREVYLALAVLPGDEAARYVSRTRVGSEVVPGYEPVKDGDVSMTPFPADDTGARLEAVLAQLRREPEQAPDEGEEGGQYEEDSDETDAATSGWWPLPWWGWLLAGLALGALVFWKRDDIGRFVKYRRKPDYIPITGPGGSPTSAPNPTSPISVAAVPGESGKPAKPRTDMERHLLAKLTQLEEAVRTLGDIVNQQKEEIKGIKDDLASGRSAAPAQETYAEPRTSKATRDAGPRSRSAAPPRPASTPEQVGAAFVSWCQALPGRLDEPSQFERHLQAETGTPGFAVEEVHREHNATTARYAKRVQAGTPYWLVRLGADEFLLPWPKRGSFNDVQRDSFDFSGAEPVPATLQAATPARLQAQGDGWGIAKKGALT